MAKLEKKLAEWLQQGLINKIQVDGICHYEASQSNASWMVYSFIALGSTVIGIGIISLVAANWATIPDLVKLGSALLLLVALAGTILHTQARSGSLLIETQLAVFVLSCLATIGLIGQIYHSSNTLADALLFWSAITFAAVTLSRQRFLPFLWTSIFLSAFLSKLWDYSVVFVVAEESLLVGLLMALPFFCNLLAILIGKLPWLPSFATAFRHWSLIGTGLGIIVVDLWSISGFQLGSAQIIMFLPAICLSLASVVTMVLDKNLSRLQKKLLFAVIFLYVVMFPVCLQYFPWRSMGAVFAILIVGFYAVFVGLHNQRHLFTLLTLFIGLRFLLVYFSAFGGLASTGFGLIFSGLLILGGVAFWHKSSERLRQWLMGLEQ